MKKLTNVYAGIPTLEDTFYTLLSQFDVQIMRAIDYSHGMDKYDLECETWAQERMSVINTTFYVAGLVKERLSDRITYLIAYKKYKELHYIISNLKHIVNEAMCDY